ncbi:MAG: endolytic transglycosylase MltG, partial [Anaerolineae bacterium]|nr:endolytic transglycosylase MltG [Anaerolineae bacterium]
MRGNRLQTTLIAFIVFGFVCVLAFGALFLFAGDDIIDFARNAYLRISLSAREDDLNTPISPDTTIIRFRVDSGEGVRSVANRLSTQGIISDADLFVDYTRSVGIDSRIQAGTFFISKSQNIKQIAQILTNSSFNGIVFTVVPGHRIEQVAEVIDATRPYFSFSGADFLAVVGEGADIPADFATEMGIPVGASLEGFLYPNTYQLSPDVTPIELRDT